MSKYLITGGAGFIGAHLAQSLLARGDKVVIIDDFNDRYDPALKEARIKALLPNLPEENIIRADIRDREVLPKLCQQHNFDAIAHLAAWANVQMSIDKPYTYGEANVDGTINILEAARQNGIKHVLFASTSSVYGEQNQPPFKEDMNILHPISPYAATKVGGEALCHAWHYLHKIPITIVRFFTVYGPWGRPDMALFKFTESILAGKPIEMRGVGTKRDFTYVDDIVSGVIGGLDKPEQFEVYNLGNGDAVELPRFIKAIETSLSKKADIQEVPLPPGDVPATLADITKAKTNLGYSPQTQVETGVDNFVTWYRDFYQA